jgi:RimJ/RimL family protein N-acetyltransferase
MITTIGSSAAISGQVVARGERVHLRSLVKSDRPLLDRWAGDPDLDYLAGSELLRAYRRAGDRLGFIEDCLTDPGQAVMIIVSADGRSEPLGMGRLFNIHRREGFAFLEMLIAERQAVGRGFGVEAGKLICAWGLDVLGLERIEAKVYDYNTLSINALKRNGFRLEGVLRRAGFQDGQRCDMLVFGILREELEAQRQKESNPARFSFI